MSKLGEGFWRSREAEASDLPWPKPEPGWPERADFLADLDRVESVARRTEYRGLSPCRLCNCRNGHIEFSLDDWAWPQGFRHYVADHEVRPSQAFAEYITRRSRQIFK